MKAWAYSEMLFDLGAGATYGEPMRRLHAFASYYFTYSTPGERVGIA